MMCRFTVVRQSVEVKADKPQGRIMNMLRVQANSLPYMSTVRRNGVPAK
jgi:hypothetical protein